MTNNKGLKIFCVASSALFLLATVLFMAFNMPFVYALESFGTLGVTVLLFAGVLIFQIISAKKEEAPLRAMVSLAIVCLLFLVIPIRGYLVSRNIAEPFQHIDVDLVGYEQDYEHGEIVIRCTLQYINKTGVELSDINGTINFYDGDSLVSSYDVDYNVVGGISSSEPEIITYSIRADERLTLVEYSNLRVIYTFKSITTGIYDFSYDPVEVILK